AVKGAIKGAIQAAKGTRARIRPIWVLERCSLSRKRTKTEPNQTNCENTVLVALVAKLQGRPRNFSTVVGGLLIDRLQSRRWPGGCGCAASRSPLDHVHNRPGW